MTKRWAQSRRFEVISTHSWSTHIAYRTTLSTPGTVIDERGERRGGVNFVVVCSLVFGFRFSVSRPPISRLPYRTRLIQCFQRIVFQRRKAKARLFILRFSLPTSVVNCGASRRITQVQPQLITGVDSVPSHRSYFLPRFAFRTLFRHLPHFRRTNRGPVGHSPRIAHVRRRSFLAFPSRSRCNEQCQQRRLVTTVETFLRSQPFRFHQHPTSEAGPTILVPVSGLVHFPHLVVKMAISVVVKDTRSRERRGVHLFRKHVNGDHRHRYPILRLSQGQTNGHREHFIHAESCVTFDFLLR